MSMQTANRARLPLYKLRNPGHVLTAGGVQVEIRYYTRAYVRVGELVFRHYFKVLWILPDVVLGLPWLRSYNPTLNWKEWYADIQHGSSSDRLSFDESRHSTKLQSQAASKLDLLSILSSSASEASPVGNPTPHAKESLDLHSSTHVQHMYDESETEDGITDEECSDMEIEYIRCRNSKVRSVELISRGIKCFCAACLDPQGRSSKCIRCKQAMTMTGLTLFDANCLFDYTSGQTSLTWKRRSMETYLRIDLVEIIVYTPIRKTIHRGCTLIKWTRVN